MFRNVSALAASFMVLCGGVAAAGSEPSTYIEPAQILIEVGQAQPFQLLDRNGNEIRASTWVVSNPDIAELRVEDGRAIITAKAEGQVTLSSGSDSAAAEIYAHANQPQLPQDTRWILRPMDGRFVRALWAWSTWGGSEENADPAGEDTVAYYYEDRGTAGAHVRATRKDGLQAWQWPNPFSKEVPHMICGDIYGGVVVEIGDKQSRVLVDLDAAGQERWRANVPGFAGKSFAYNMLGVLYLTEENASMTEVQVVGLDARTGRQQLSFVIPGSDEILRNLKVQEGKLVCAPASENTVRLPVRHSKMMTDISGVTSLGYSVFHLVADGGKCTAGSIMPLDQIHLAVTQRLMMFDINNELIHSTSTIEENVTEGAAATTWIQAVVPTGDIIVGETGTGNFLAVRRTRQLWRGTGPGSLEEFQYRVTEARQVKYRFPVTLGSPDIGSTMLLGGENRLGFTTRGRIVFAFDTESGQEIWRWESTRSNVFACAALTNDEVLVQEGDGYVILKDGRVTASRDQAYMLFVAKLVYDPKDF